VRRRRIVRLLCEPIEARAKKSGGRAVPGAGQQG
jgi:hypothetical protein